MQYEKFYWDHIRARIRRINEQFRELESISFLRLIVNLFTGAEYDEIDEYIVEGPGDLGADAIYFDVNDEEKRFKLFIIQTKYNKSACEKGAYKHNIPQEVINKFKNIFDFFASNGTGGANPDLQNKKEEYNSLIDDGYILDRIFFVSANLGIGPAENTRLILHRWLEQNPFRDKIEYIHLGLKEIFEKIEELETPNISEDIQLYGRYFEFTTPDIKGLISTISGNELVRIYEKFKDKLFQLGVRYFLGENKINKKIIESASNPTTKDKFWFLNNGITIICNDYEKISPTSENLRAKLKNFQIVNGTQTTRCVYEAYKKTGSVDEIKILVKILKADKEELTEKITESTNSQNPVNSRDLKANDEIQKLLEKSLRDRGFFYQRKRNQFIDKPRNEVIDNLLFAQIYYSFYFEKPHEARNQRSKLFGDDSVYNKIFNEQLDVEKVIFLHLLYRKLISLIRELKREPNLEIPKDVIDRSKLFLLYALRVWFEEKGNDIDDKEFINNTKNIENLTKEFLNEILLIIHKEVQAMLDNDESLNKVKAFQRKELADRIKDKIKEKIERKEL